MEPVWPEWNASGGEWEVRGRGGNRTDYQGLQHQRENFAFTRSEV